MEDQYYWDAANGCATTENTGVFLFKGFDNDTYIENWWVDKEQNLVIDFTYSKNTIDIGYHRINYFKAHNVEPRFLRSLIVPIDIYKQLIATAR